MKKMKNVSKQIFLNGLVCPTLGWLLRSGEIEQTTEVKLSLGERFRIEQGFEIGKRARELYPGGLLVDDVDLASASSETERLMSNEGVQVIFEGTFPIDSFVARADILRRKDDGWHLIEVKSSVNDKEEFIDDMAYTTMVLDRCGVNISGVSLLLVSGDFRLGMPDEELFREIDHTDEVLFRVEEFKPLWQQIKELTGAPIKPEPSLLFECRKCELFEVCLGKDIENHIFEIPRLSQAKFGELTESGIVCIEDVPDRFPLTENQTRVRNCVVSGQPFVGSSLGIELESISWPAYYLDFETVMTTIPLYPNVAPYTQIPSQYSIHRCSDIGVIIKHLEYLADPSRDCRRELAESLIRDLGKEGSIIIYSTFEKAVVNGLIGLFPDLSEKLDSLSARMIDLVAVLRRNFYHPDFHGSTSLKRTLPVLVPEMSYDNMEIADGDSAMAAFAYLALGKYQAGEAEAVKSRLLEYCKQDTLAMVELHRKLAAYVLVS